MLRIEQAYWLIAAFLAGAAWLNLRERRWSHAAFWAVLATLLGGGDAVLRAAAAHDELPAQLAGAGVLMLAAPSPRMHRGHLVERDAAAREADARRLRHKLFGPALLIPLVTLLVALFGAYLVIGGKALFATPQMTLTGLALACVVALFAASRVARTPVHEGVAEGRRLLDAIGWAALLPLLLAALGQVFTQSGVGAAIAAIATDFLPTGNATAALLAFALGMVLFTVIMGNAFAAFPVMMAGIGLPLLIRQHGAHPAILGSMGMLCGYCGTLLTPMAADFNLVPAALLELRNPYGVIKAQAWSALWIFICTFLLMWMLVFH